MAKDSWKYTVQRWKGDPLSFVLEALFRIDENTWDPWIPGTPLPKEPPIGPEKWQGDFLRDVAKAITEGRRRFTVRAGHGVGKAQPKSLIIDTPDGKRRFGDLHPGNVVFGKSGQPTRVTGVYDRGQLPVYRVTFSDKTSTLACGEHLWSVRGRQERRKKLDTWRVLSTEEIVALGVKRKNGESATRQWEIPVVDPVVYPFQWTPADPYTLGVWLGDGTKNTGLITTADEEVVERIKVAGYDVAKQNWSKLTEDKASVWSVHGLSTQLSFLGLKDLGSHERYVPWPYFHNIPEVRAEILRGLLDSDGTISADGCAQFTSVSEKLAEDVVWLVRSLGGIARLNGGKPKSYVNAQGERIEGRPAYLVTLTMPPDFAPFYIQRKKERLRAETERRYLARWIESIEPEGTEDCVCISVDAEDQLYVANDFIVTHNSTVEAWLILWFVLFYRDLKVPVTANSQDQLRDVVWAEVAKWHRELPKFLKDMIEVGSERIYVKADPEGAFSVARTSRSDKPESLQGFHAETLAFIIEEASGIDDIIFETAGGALSSPDSWVFMFGNPTRPDGYFYRSHNDNRDTWRCYHIPCSKSSRVSPDYPKEIAAEFGSDSNVWRVRVDGSFPLSEDDVLIPLGLVEAAVNRDVGLYEAPIIWGLDVARYGDDASALCVRQGGVLLEPVVSWKKTDLMQTTGRVVAKYRETPVEARPSAINVDVIGLGAGVVDRLREQGLPVRGINVGECAAVAPERFMRLRDELWWFVREWFETRAVMIPDDPDLVSELIRPKYKLLSTGKLQIESKDDMKKRGVKSPNKADALCLTFAGGDFMHERRAPVARINYNPFTMHDQAEYERDVQQQTAGMDYTPW